MIKSIHKIKQGQIVGVRRNGSQLIAYAKQNINLKPGAHRIKLDFSVSTQLQMSTLKIVSLIGNPLQQIASTKTIFGKDMSGSFLNFKVDKQTVIRSQQQLAKIIFQVSYDGQNQIPRIIHSSEQYPQQETQSAWSIISSEDPQLVLTIANNNFYFNFPSYGYVVVAKNRRLCIVNQDGSFTKLYVSSDGKEFVTQQTPFPIVSIQTIGSVFIKVFTDKKAYSMNQYGKFEQKQEIPLTNIIGFPFTVQFDESIAFYIRDLQVVQNGAGGIVKKTMNCHPSKTPELHYISQYYGFVFDQSYFPISVDLKEGDTLTLAPQQKANCLTLRLQQQQGTQMNVRALIYQPFKKMWLNNDFVWVTNKPSSKHVIFVTGRYKVPKSRIMSVSFIQTGQDKDSMIMGQKSFGESNLGSWIMESKGFKIDFKNTSQNNFLKGPIVISYSTTIASFFVKFFDDPQYSTQVIRYYQRAPFRYLCVTSSYYGHIYIANSSRQSIVEQTSLYNIANPQPDPHPQPQPLQWGPFSVYHGNLSKTLCFSHDFHYKTYCHAFALKIENKILKSNLVGDQHMAGYEATYISGLISISKVVDGVKLFLNPVDLTFTDQINYFKIVQPPTQMTTITPIFVTMTNCSGLGRFRRGYPYGPQQFTRCFFKHLDNKIQVIPMRNQITSYGGIGISSAYVQNLQQIQPFLFKGDLTMHYQSKSWNSYPQDQHYQGVQFVMQYDQKQLEAFPDVINTTLFAVQQGSLFQVGIGSLDMIRAQSTIQNQYHPNQFKLAGTLVRYQQSAPIKTTVQGVYPLATFFFVGKVGNYYEVIYYHDNSDKMLDSQVGVWLTTVSDVIWGSKDKTQVVFKLA